MTSANASSNLPPSNAFAKRASNPPATVALVLAIVGVFVTEIPFSIGILAGGPEDLAALILGIIGIVLARRRGISKAKAIAATIVAAAALLGIPLGEGTLW